MVGGEAPAQQQRSTSASRPKHPGCTSMHFGENQLSPLSIGISPLSTGHPSLLQQTPVRPSMSCYGHFSLPMDSSSGFGSTPGDERAIDTRFRCGSAYDWLNRPPRVTRRIILQKARRQAIPEGIWPFDCMQAYGFRVCFTPLAGVLFTVPSRYCALSVAACK